MPSSSSFCAMISLSSTEKETDSPCVPSRRVVSNVKIFIGLRLGRFGYLVLRYACLFFLLQERHHRTQFRAHLLDRLIAGLVAHGQELLAAGLVLFDPLAGEFPRLDLGEDLLHL